MKKIKMIVIGLFLAIGGFICGRKIGDKQIEKLEEQKAKEISKLEKLKEKADKQLKENVEKFKKLKSEKSK